MNAVLVSVAVNALLIGLLYFLAKKRINRLLGGDEALEEIKDEVNRLIVELNQTADRNIGIIEERITRLKKLVAESDRKITLLGKESEKVRIGAAVYDKLKRSRSLVSAETTDAVAENTLERRRGGPENRATVPYPNAPRGYAAAEGSSLSIAGRSESAAGPGASAGPTAAGPTTAGPTTDGGNAISRVLELHRQGFEPKIIASKTGTALGEIELIISLAAGSR